MDFPNPAICRRSHILLFGVFGFLPLLSQRTITRRRRFNFTLLLELLSGLHQLLAALRCHIFNSSHYVFLTTLLKIEFRYLFKAHCYCWMISKRRTDKLGSNISWKYGWLLHYICCYLQWNFGQGIKSPHYLDTDACRAKTPATAEANDLRV